MSAASPAIGDRSLTSVQGTVTAVQANYYWVTLQAERGTDPRFEDANLEEVSEDSLRLLCTRRSRLKKIGQQVMVGDRVQLEEIDWTSKRAAISDVYPRHTQIDRPPVANADQILLVFALAEPSLDPFQLSRFLVKAESTGLSVGLCLNKCDLVTGQAQEEWSDRLQQWGYKPVIVSLAQGSSLTAVEHQLSQKITVVSGPSGVGKSSLINRLIPEIQLRVSAVSGKLGRGRHTTRHVELFQLPQGGLLADSPGFNQPDLQCQPSELAQFFPEVRQRLAENSCQFSNCLHRNEPNCVVRGVWERYEHYLTFLDEVVTYQEAMRQSSEAEPTTKFKNRAAGKLEAEPKLATKRYRRPSRKTEKQTLQHLYQDAETSWGEGD
ncbi:MAG: small ribosomal subunit biogenesis GTPase RsgA [Oculatellaceae cyanobacterium Prado106]|jgi:ribosome biogenesis GTPase|nr:small ribosomal subunit biogenesis GTPase RsgA [Oculatellaceae cyanobacterium Prado106]